MRYFRTGRQRGRTVLASRRHAHTAPFGGSRALLVAAGRHGCVSPHAPAGALRAPRPTPRPTPLVTPDPHLADPTTADDVFRGPGQGRAADEPPTTPTPVRPRGRSSSASTRRTRLAARRSASTGRPHRSPGRPTGARPARPGQGDPPIAIAGLNILVEWGPTTGDLPPQPDTAKLAALRDLATNLDVLLSPLRARAVVAVPVPARSAQASPDPEASPETTPEP